MHFNDRATTACVEIWKRAHTLLAAVAILFAFTESALCQQSTTSAAGINLSALSYASAEQPFLNIFKTGNGWTTKNSSGGCAGGCNTNEEALLYSSFLDANGYPTTLTGGPAHNFTAVGTLVLRSLQGPYYYPAGRYVLLYDGQGTLSYGFDAVKNAAASTPGRDVLDVTPSSAGVLITLTSTDPNNTGNYVRNIRLVYAPAASATTIDPNEQLLASGEMFNPTFITRLSGVRVIRFMDWMATNTSYQQNWSSRPTVSWAFWDDGYKFNNAGAGGNIVPAEVMFALCNELNADAWLNMPLLATDDYVTQFAQLAHSSLSSNLTAYVEYGNELWNQAFPASLATQVGALGQSMFPNSPNQWSAIFSYGIVRAVQVGKLWKSAWGPDSGRIFRVLGGQSAYDARNDYILSFTAPAAFAGTAASNVDAFAVAPYFGYTVPDTFTLDQLFTEINAGGLVPTSSGGYPGGMLKQALDWMTQNAAIAAKYGLPLVSYEGGQSLVDGTHSDTALQNLYLAANRDPRMSAVYTTYLNGWKSAGGQFFIPFNDIEPYTTWGYWGALENVNQTSSPKYDAIIGFIKNTTCWWANCTRTAAATTSSYLGTTAGTLTTSATSSPTTTTTTAATTSTTTTTTTAGTSSSTATAPISTSSGGSTTPTSSGTGTSSTASPSPSSGAPAPTSPPPVINIQSPSNGAILKGNGTLNIATSATGSSQIQSITIFADGQPIQSCASSYCSSSWAGKAISPGTHVVSATAVDHSGATSSASVLFSSLR